jgi:hypothetical protein
VHRSLLIPFAVTHLASEHQPGILAEQVEAALGLQAARDDSTLR